MHDTARHTAMQSRARGLFSPSSVIAPLLAGFLIVGHGAVHAETAAPAAVTLVELDEADCELKGGKLIALQNTDPTHGYKVWVDRWFMQVQTADHTSHILQPGQAPVPLGCSQTLSGDQHWTLYDVTPLE